MGNEVEGLHEENGEDTSLGKSNLEALTETCGVGAIRLGLSQVGDTVIGSARVREAPTATDASGRLFTRDVIGRVVRRLELP